MHTPLTLSHPYAPLQPYRQRISPTPLPACLSGLARHLKLMWSCGLICGRQGGAGSVVETFRVRHGYQILGRTLQRLARNSVQQQWKAEVREGQEEDGLVRGTPSLADADGGVVW